MTTAIKRLRNSTRCSTIVISSLFLAMLFHRHKDNNSNKDKLVESRLPSGINTSPINGWETTNQMIRHHISQLKGMKTDTEHLEGQGINQPSQNKENAVWFNIVTSF